MRAFEKDAYINEELACCLILLQYHPTSHILCRVMMYFGLILFYAVWTFNIVYTSSCNFLVEFHVEFIYHSCQVLLSKLYLWVRPHWKQKVHIKMSVSREIQYIIWVPPSKLFILKHTNNNEKQHKGLFLETAVTNRLVTAWSPALDSLNSQWLQGTRLTPMCWPFEVLALKKRTKSEVSHCITKSPHAFFKGEPGEKKQPDPRWCEKQEAFCYLPGAAEVGEKVLFRRPP